MINYETFIVILIILLVFIVHCINKTNNIVIIIRTKSNVILNSLRRISHLNEITSSLKVSNSLKKSEKNSNIYEDLLLKEYITKLNKKNKSVYYSEIDNEIGFPI